MRRVSYPLLLPLLPGGPVKAQHPREAESNYLQHRAAALNERIDITVRERKLSRKKAARLHLAVGKVQTSAGHLQTRNGTISRSEAGGMNRQLNDVERALPPQQ